MSRQGIESMLHSHTKSFNDAVYYEIEEQRDKTLSGKTTVDAELEAVAGSILPPQQTFRESPLYLDQARRAGFQLSEGVVEPEPINLEEDVPVERVLPPGVALDANGKADPLTPMCVDSSSLPSSERSSRRPSSRRPTGQVAGRGRRIARGALSSHPLLCRPRR